MKILVTSTINIELKEEAFTEQFMEDFRKSFFPFFDLEDHAKHIAQLLAREVIEEVEGKYRGVEQFVEGYGRIGDFVSKALVESSEQDID